MMTNHKNSVKSNLKTYFLNTWLKDAFFFSWHVQSFQSIHSLYVAPIPFLGNGTYWKCVPDFALMEHFFLCLIN